MFINFRKLLYAFSIISFIGNCNAADIELGDLPEKSEHMPEISAPVPQSFVLFSNETLEKAAYLGVNLSETLEGITKSTSLIGLANFPYPNNPDLQAATASLSFASAIFNGVKNFSRTKVSQYHKQRTGRAEQVPALTDVVRTPTNLRPIQHDNVTDFELGYLAVSKKIWETAAKGLGYLEVGGQYAAPALISYAMTLPDGDSYKKHILTVGYGLNASSALFYFYRVLAQNLSQYRAQEHDALEQMPDV